MSLINQVLRDLDARHAPHVDRAALPQAVHPLPPELPRTWPKLVVAVTAAGVLAWYLFAAPARSPELPLPPVVVQAPPPMPPKIAAPAAEPVVFPAAAPRTLTAAAGTGRTPALAPATVPALKPKGVAANLPPETKLRVVSNSAATEPAAAAAATPVAPAKPSLAAAETGAATSIDKRARTASVSEAAEADYRKAMAALRRGAVSEAVDGLRKALRAEPQHISARQALLSLLVEQQQWTEAQALMEEGLALDAAQTGWAMALARLQFEHGKLAEAVETLLRHATHAEQHADYQAFLALLLQKQKRPADAAQRYRVALALKPNESRWWYGLGLVLESEQKPQEARGAFLKARETGNLTPDVLNAVEQRLR